MDSTRKVFLGWMLATLMAGSAFPAAAITIALDLDPGTPGIQNTASVGVGHRVLADVVIFDAAGPGTTVQGYEFDVDFPQGTLSVASVRAGSFLSASFGTVILEQDVAPPDVNFALVALGLASHAASGILASIAFDAIAASAGALLDLNDVLLSNDLGLALPVDAVSDATLVVVRTSAVDTPPTVALIVAALVVVALLRRAFSSPMLVLATSVIRTEYQSLSGNRGTLQCLTSAHCSRDQARIKFTDQAPTAASCAPGTPGPLRQG